jgi:hypothetical protein
MNCIFLDSSVGYRSSVSCSGLRYSGTIQKKEGTNSDYSSLTTYTLCFNKRFISNPIRPAKLPPIIDIGRHFVSTD